MYLGSTKGREDIKRRKTRKKDALSFPFWPNTLRSWKIALGYSSCVSPCKEKPGIVKISVKYLPKLLSVAFITKAVQMNMPRYIGNRQSLR